MDLLDSNRRTVADIGAGTAGSASARPPRRSHGRGHRPRTSTPKPSPYIQQRAQREHLAKHRTAPRHPTTEARAQLPRRRPDAEGLPRDRPSPAPARQPAYGAQARRPLRASLTAIRNGAGTTASTTADLRAEVEHAGFRRIAATTSPGPTARITSSSSKSDSPRPERPSSYGSHNQRSVPTGYSPGADDSACVSRPRCPLSACLAERMYLPWSIDLKTFAACVLL